MARHPKMKGQVIAEFHDLTIYGNLKRQNVVAKDRVWTNIRHPSRMSTQKTAWLIVACCLLLLYAYRGYNRPAQEAVWDVTRGTDMISDQRVTSASLDGLSSDDFWGLRDMQIDRREEASVLISSLDLTASPLFKSDDDMDRDVNLRFDSKNPEAERWRAHAFSDYSAVGWSIVGLLLILGLVRVCRAGGRKSP